MKALHEHPASHLLKRHNLKVTDLRVKLLHLLSSHKTAVPQQKIERSPDLACDRVTLYRMLITFEQLNIIHKIFDCKGKPNYALTSGLNSSGQQTRRHLHFNCLQCNAVYCLDQFTPPNIEVPIHFKVIKVDTNIVGVCPECKESHEKHAF